MHGLLDARRIQRDFSHSDTNSRLGRHDAGFASQQRRM
jgi:hypothetical protein